LTFEPVALTVGAGAGAPSSSLDFGTGVAAGSVVGGVIGSMPGPAESAGAAGWVVAAGLADGGASLAGGVWPGPIGPGDSADGGAGSPDSTGPGGCGGLASVSGSSPLPLGAYRPRGTVEPVVSLAAATRPSARSVRLVAPAAPLLIFCGRWPQGRRLGGVGLAVAAAGWAAGALSGICSAPAVSVEAAPMAPTTATAKPAARRPRRVFNTYPSLMIGG